MLTTPPLPPGLDPPAFAAKWKRAAPHLSERAAAQQHFLDLCALVGHRAPADDDPAGAEFALEKGVVKAGAGGSGAGFADAWKRGRFALEYKRRGRNLGDAYRQLLAYKDDLENPPLLIVSDLERFEVHCNFTGTVKRVYAFDLDDLGRSPAPGAGCHGQSPLDVLRACFFDPERLRPARTTAQVTEEAAREFGGIARSLVARGGAEPHAAARVLLRVLFCLFAEDVGLLPRGVFERLVENTRTRPEAFAARLGALFDAMAHPGGSFGEHDIRHFNGGLFDNGDVGAVRFAADEVAALATAAKLDWSSIEPSIFGTLFERSLDPAKRSQLGAHYTSREDILLLVEPVLMAPLRRRWQAVRARVDGLLARRFALMRTAPGHVRTPADRAQATRLDGEMARALRDFADEIRAVRVLDPACGSGNFLYVALRSLLDLEKSVITFASGACGLTGFFPQVAPEQMRGLEVNEYAHELASVTVWIGYIQWMRENGFGYPDDPVLRRLTEIRRQDAVLGFAPDGTPTEPEWPDADILLGNPPFLGDKKMRAELGDGYVDALRGLYAGRVPGGADLVCYWFERARALIAAGKVQRAGLLTTNGIRFGANREVLDRIKETGDIFMAWSDRPWVLNGAAVRVSMVGFDDGTETERTLEGAPVSTISPDLTARSVDVTTAAILPENAGIVFLGMMKGGPFDIDGDTARVMLAAPLNVNGRPNSDVVKRRLGAQDVTGRDRGGYVIDFVDMAEEDASLYELPFEYVRQTVKPLRDANRDTLMRQNWWRHGRSRPALRAAVAGKLRCIVTPEVAKHRLFIWMPTDTIPDHTCHVFARDDDYFFGVLHSRVHEVWSLAVGNFMGMGNDPRYNSSRTFGTFPMPFPPGKEPGDESDPRYPLVAAIADAARDLDAKRNAWLTPPDADPAELKKRTLTNLYNARPAWLRAAHARLDRAVYAAYGWPEAGRPEAGATDAPDDAALPDDELLARLLALNRERAG